MRYLVITGFLVMPVWESNVQQTRDLVFEIDTEGQAQFKACPSTNYNNRGSRQQLGLLRRDPGLLEHVLLAALNGRVGNGVVGLGLAALIEV